MGGGALCRRRHSQQGEGCEEEIRRCSSRKILRFLTGATPSPSRICSKPKTRPARQTQTPALRRRGSALLVFSLGHDLFGKPVSTFPDHALKFRGLGPADYSCPYLWSTARQSPLMRQ